MPFGNRAFVNYRPELMFEIYLSMTRAGMDMFRVGLKMSETLVASREVIDRRVEIMNDAVRDPLAGDYRELGLMVPEKVEAFWESGKKLSDGWWSAQRDMGAQLQHLSAIMLRGGLPSAADVQTLNRRGTRAMSRSAAAAGAALAPIHKAATANARRLGKANTGRAKARGS